MKTRLIITLIAASILASGCSVQGMAGRIGGSASRTLEYSVMNQIDYAISSTIRNAGERIRSKAASRNDAWDCTCGTKHLNGNYCPHCGKKKQDADKPKEQTSI